MFVLKQPLDEGFLNCYRKWGGCQITMPVSLSLIISLNERTHPDTFILFQAQEKAKGGRKKERKKIKKQTPHNHPSTQRGVSEVWNAPWLFEEEIYTWHPPWSSLLRLACVQINRRLAAAGTSSYTDRIIWEKCVGNCSQSELEKKTKMRAELLTRAVGGGRSRWAGAVHEEAVAPRGLGCLHGTWALAQPGQRAMPKGSQGQPDAERGSKYIWCPLCSNHPIRDGVLGFHLWCRTSYSSFPRVKRYCAIWNMAVLLYGTPKHLWVFLK